MAFYNGENGFDDCSELYFIFVDYDSVQVDLMQFGSFTTTNQSQA